MEPRQITLATAPAARAAALGLPAYSDIDPLKATAALRAAGLDAESAAAVLTQARLRERARAKFGDLAEGMAFTDTGLEQATRLVVAARHAARYRDAGIERVADLTAGIGADAMALAAAGIAVMAFEQDEATALVADHNLRHWEHAVVVHGDSLASVAQCDVDAVFADPARRTDRGRRHDPRDYTPPLDVVLALRDQFPALGLKLGPGAPRDTAPPDAEAEWLSIDGDVVELGVWCGPLATASVRRATVVRGGVEASIEDAGTVAEVGVINDYLIEPDGAVVRSGLVGEIAAAVDGSLLASDVAYVTAAVPFTGVAATSYRVVDQLPFSVKGLRAYLRERSVGTLEIKKRGIAVTPEQLRPQLRLRGDESATVALTRVGGEPRAIVLERLARAT